MKIHDVEQRSPEWYALRAGKPTASEFGGVVTPKGEPSKTAATYAVTLAIELFAGKRVDAWGGSAWTERGRELEEEALDLYAFATDAEITPVGFVTDDDETEGCSPDALVGADGMAEVKCLKGENHAKAIMYFQANGSCPPGYTQQTQGQLMICERAWCDLVFYHPDLPLLTIRQTPDADIVAGLRAEIPKLLTERDRVLAALHKHAGTA